VDQLRGLRDDYAKFEQKGDTYHLAIGPAAVYWNPSNTASGDYTVKATFTDGLLELTLPKKEEAKPKKIQLEIRKKLATAA